MIQVIQQEATDNSWNPSSLSLSLFLTLTQLLLSLSPFYTTAVIISQRDQGKRWPSSEKCFFFLSSLLFFRLRSLNLICPPWITSFQVPPQANTNTTNNLYMQIHNLTALLALLLFFVSRILYVTFYRTLALSLSLSLSLSLLRCAHSPSWNILSPDAAHLFLPVTRGYALPSLSLPGHLAYLRLSLSRLPWKGNTGSPFSTSAQRPLNSLFKWSSLWIYAYCNTGHLFHCFPDVATSSARMHCVTVTSLHPPLSLSHNQCLSTFYLKHTHILGSCVISCGRNSVTKLKSTAPMREWKKCLPSLSDSFHCAHETIHQNGHRSAKREREKLRGEKVIRK